jgi:DNA adenine methylase
LGGGAVFFHLCPENSIIGDINEDIIAVYKGLKINWKYVKRSLQYHQRMHSDNYYYTLRNKVPRNFLQRASRMIYLNRTCFNGIYRVNKDGLFNVPKGNRDLIISSNDEFEAISSSLKNAIIKQCDFEVLINNAKENDFIFADPPYTVRHNLNGFIKYNEVLFSWKDQERLARALIRAKERGVKILSTNANHTSIRELYENNGFIIKVVSRFSSISASSENRKSFEELVIYS